MRILFILLQLIAPAEAIMTPTPSPSAAPSGFLEFSKKGGEDAQTYRMIEDQNRIMDAGSRNMISLQDSIVSGQQRAKDMVELLKNQELQKTFGDLNSRGKQILQENPEMKSPLAIVAGAASLWIGRTIRIIKDEKFKLSTRFEARARSGEFSMESPFLNGKLIYSGGDGVTANMNHQFDIIQSRAEMNYSQRDQVISGVIVHPLMPHIDLSFGAAQWQTTNQTDGRASIQYNLSF